MFLLFQCLFAIAGSSKEDPENGSILPRNLVTSSYVVSPIPMCPTSRTSLLTRTWSNTGAGVMVSLGVIHGHHPGQILQKLIVVYLVSVATGAMTTSATPRL